MLQPRTYPELLGKALTFDADPFIVMVDDDEPWIEGLFMTVLIGILAGGAQIIGGWLLTLSMPPSDAVLEAVLERFVNGRRVCHFQVVAKKLQVGKPCHHAQHRRQVQEVMEADGCQDGAEKQKQDEQGAATLPGCWPVAE